ncbi:hypothetical protein Tco_0868529, partial [Tanacetum coccineum]
EFLNTYRMSDIEMGLDVADTLCFQLRGDGSDRLIPDKRDLRDYWIEISSDIDFLGPAPSYVLIRDPVRRLCHMMIAYSISGRRQAPEKGRKTGARLSGGHFIMHLAMHFGLVSDEGLRGLQVVTREPSLIDLHKLGRLNICTRYCDTWAWVAQGPERQQATSVGAHEAGPAAEERIERVEEEMHDLRRDDVGFRGVVESFTTEQSRVSTWLISYMTQVMDASGHTYQAFDSTLISSTYALPEAC